MYSFFVLLEIATYFNLAYCITIHCVQGSAYDFPYTIYQFDMLDARLKYVSLSRATKFEYINIIEKIN